ncbi:50S ribosomal protein L3 [Cohnella thailandensis]|jgi:50S ribosomal protein L3, bacterial|uniref:Large ribosomal subunit protein uL3 n=1 Tax=Cohnella thailandensis TaxID=557557 RepID=A0A841SW34_9BACL|nr:50S ribosomal protein L3 [Cohnella thailandensis]MBB6636493.1 50S ribosomal protein L3 [Cohnella thailandensis]MBP1977635.1 large subunit ribosomal protein L3 [Cohnella thailandensis]
MKGILGRKIGMTQVFAADGSVVPVTVVEATPNVVLQVKTAENDAYEAVQLGFADKREKLSNKPAIGHAKKANTGPKRFIREISGSQGLEVGAEVKVDVFAEGEFVDVTGVSKGKGTAGAIKRWGFQRGKMTHGSKYHRGNGSLATIRDANRVPKGKKMHGRLGSETITVQNLEIVKVDVERNVLLIKGSVPGARNSYLKIRAAVKK